MQIILLLINAVIFICLAMIHVYWALGGKCGSDQDALRLLQSL